MTKLLRYSGLLFGEPGVVRANLPERPAKEVLGWLAQGYVQRGRLRNPAGLVYRRLQRGEMPQQRYMERAEKYLPAAYRRAVGWTGDGGRAAEAGKEAEGEEPVGGGERQGGEEGAGGTDAVGEEQVDASLLGEVNGRTVLAAWEQAVRALQSEFPRGNCLVYLAEARPGRWEAEGRLVVRVRTRYGRDWLRERAGRTLERMLCGILNREVEVGFEWEG